MRPRRTLLTLLLPLTIKYNVDHTAVKPAPFETSPSKIIHPPSIDVNPKVKHETLVGRCEANAFENLTESPRVPSKLNAFGEKSPLYKRELPNAQAGIGEEANVWICSLGDLLTRPEKSKLCIFQNVPHKSVVKFPSPMAEGYTWNRQTK